MGRKTHQPQRHAAQIHRVRQRHVPAHDQAHLVVEQRGGRQVVRGHRRVVDETHVGRAAFHQVHHVGRTAPHHGQVHVFVAADEAGHDVGHEVVAERVHGGKAHRAVGHAFLLAHGVKDAVDVLVGGLNALQQAAARYGQFHAPAGTREQGFAHMCFQRRQLPAQAGLRLVQVLGGAR
ncbi:hypothetical protein G6F22_019344 [Rhizopus arrhizus]|nr:hypothetical protein G6F22_019344 [Rhizopus arrhizus]